ncbi:MAG: hypothetical protein NC409_12195 [Clostridium sp.]|nr:hypothetical protein [Clostridium sp.]
MKRNILYLSIAAGFLMLSGCGKETLPDTYMEGSDFQYTWQGSWDWEPQMQRGEKGYYFRQGEFVYYLDEGTGELFPLCAKADCLHDRETDQERKESCNAYLYFSEFSSDSAKGIMYYDGDLYCLTDKGFREEETILYRLSEDGAKKEQVYRWTGVSVEEWVVHRGEFYYAEHFYTYDDEGEMEEHYILKALNLTGTRKEPEAIYALEEENIFYAGFNWCKAYGNYLYFIVSGAEDRGEDELYAYEKTFVYDIAAQEVRELVYEGMPEEEDILEMTFWQDRIVFFPTVFDADDMKGSYLRTGSLYIADLDGSNAEVLMEDVPMGYNVRSDGRYLYLTNSFMATMGEIGQMDYEEEKKFWVYDENLNLADTFVLPEIRLFGTPPIGDPEQMFIIYRDDNDGWGLLRFDKSAIGSCGGAEIGLTVIPYGRE